MLGQAVVCMVYVSVHWTFGCIESEWHPWLFRSIPLECYNVTHSLGRSNTHQKSGHFDYKNIQNNDAFKYFSTNVAKTHND